ncbi:glucuronate isomerase [Pareuzebyella sediminis]|uniref:glucuronate isomerase n=1 Tax=Pareuzebyella sediminis TaxID=2607998 RepID=UPI0011EE1ACC|nr:glucuronate isomerase [Pareuzebyella sediminis]
MSKNTAFIHDDFLLENKYSQELYHDYASKMPIIDYHCHLPPKDIAENTQFENITQVWIYGDHYKWRALRTLGVDEKFITGNASDREKFMKWAESVPYTMRNPLYHWTHLELARYFDVYELLNPKSAETIYQETSSLLDSPGYRCRSLLEKMNVETVCTTDDPVDTLEYHQKVAKNPFSTKMAPAFRPDKALFIDSEGYNTYLDKLENASGVTIDSYTDLCDALKNRIAYFHANGCKISDHGLTCISAVPFSENGIKAIFKKKRTGAPVSEEEALKFQSSLLLFLAEQYHEKGWVQQFHLGALRNNNSRMLKKLGPDTGWDSIGDYSQAESLSKFLNTLDTKDKLAKTILYNLNPADNEIMATMVGNFNDGSAKGKVQYGSAWWFLDQKDGMTKQINALSNMGVLSCFIGMLTDSRSFLSFPRHEYFRRLLCQLFGDEIQRGELPSDMEWIGKLVQDICYNNAKEYFKF